MKRLKDKEIKEYTIKVSTIRRHWKDGNAYLWGEKRWVAEIIEPTIKTIVSATTEKSLMKKIKEVLNIK